MLNYRFQYCFDSPCNEHRAAGFNSDLTFFHLYKTLVPFCHSIRIFAGFTVVFFVSVKIVVNVNTCQQCQFSYAKIRGTSSRIPL